MVDAGSNWLWIARVWLRLARTWLRLARTWLILGDGPMLVDCLVRAAEAREAARARRAV